MARAAASSRWLVAAALLAFTLVAFTVSADPEPSREDCRPHIQRERQQWETHTGTGTAASPGLLASALDAIFSESRLLRERDLAIAARERDLIRVKVERGELSPEALDQPLPSAAAAQQPSLLGRLWGCVFSEGRLMRLRQEAMAAREDDLRRVKLERGDAVESAPADLSLPEVAPELETSHSAPRAPSWAASAARVEVPSSGSWLYDILFAEMNYMKMRDHAIAEREHDLVRVKVERGELPPEALSNARLANPEAAVPDQAAGIWGTLFPESRHLAIRERAMAERQRDLIRTKVERGELPASALTDLQHQVDETPASEASVGLWGVIFSEGRLMEIRRRAMAERQRSLVRTKVERGELPASALDNLDVEQPAAEQQSIAQRIWGLLFAEGRYLAERNQAIAAREADLRRVKEAIARGEDPNAAVAVDGTATGDGVAAAAPADTKDTDVTVETDLSDDDEDDDDNDDDDGDGEEEQHDEYYNVREEALAQEAARARAAAEAEARAAAEAQARAAAQAEARAAAEAARQAAEAEARAAAEAEARAAAEAEARAAAEAEAREAAEAQARAAAEARAREAADAEARAAAEAAAKIAAEAMAAAQVQAAADSDASANDDDDDDDSDSEDGDESDDAGADDADGDGDDHEESKGMEHELASTVSVTEPVADSIEPPEPATPLMQAAPTLEPAAEKPQPAPIVSSLPEPAAHAPAPTPAPVPAPAPAPAPVHAPAPAPKEVPIPAPTAAPVPVTTPTARPRSEVEDLLGLRTPFSRPLEDATNHALRELKNVAETAIKPLEQTFKYNSISTRSLGDAEIFAKPVILFLGQLNSGKSTMVNYLLGTDATRTTAMPGSGQFRVLSYGDQDQHLDGGQVTAQWEFAGLQKFGEAFLERLSGRQLKNRLLEKVSIVDVPGIMEGRQYSRIYPFNDVCQWFIDRADIIFVVFDPHHLDIGVEMENLLDQLKGRETQVRIILNKADQLPAESLLRVQGGLIWSLSPLIGSTTPPAIYCGSFLSQPYREGAPAELFRSQEDAILRDIADSMASRVGNRIALARRHAVRVRNHARMVDCYVTTFLNQQTFLSNKKKLSDDVISNPHKYHIYEGISRVTNISRYDLPDPEVYEDFFTLHPLYDFPTLASTCTYFKGCPLDKLDSAISHDLPQLLGSFRKKVDKVAGRKHG